MALLFLDSFDHYTDGGHKYLSGGTGIGPGRHGNGWTGGTLRLALAPASARCIVGAAYKFGGPVNAFLELNDSGLITVATVATAANGAVQITMFGGPTVTSGPAVFRVGQWHYIECDLTVAITGGGTTYTLAIAKVFVDGGLVLDATNVGPTVPMTGPPSTYGWSWLDVFDNAAGALDDLYVCDGSGAAPHNAPLGDVQVTVLRPTGAGAATAWTPSTGANWQNVDDTAPDGDTTYNTATSAPLDDLLTLEDIDTDDTILGAQVLIAGRRTEEGFASLAPLLRHSGTTTALASQALSTTYFYQCRQVFTAMPNSDALTDANVNALQVGYRRVT